MREETSRPTCSHIHDERKHAEPVAEEVTSFLPEPLVNPHDFNEAQVRICVAVSGCHVVAYQMSAATQRGVIRYITHYPASASCAWNPRANTLLYLFGLPIETADLPFGECRFVVLPNETMAET